MQGTPFADALCYRRPAPRGHSGALARVLRRALAGALALVLSLAAAVAYASDAVPERRKDQFPTSPAHLVVPLAYSYPGIGEGFFLMGNFSNVFDTTTDVLAMYVTGDAAGYILQVDEAPIIEKHLFFKYYYQDIQRAVINQYDTRGMKGTSKYDYTLLDVSLALQNTAVLDLTFFDRRVDFSYVHTTTEYEVQAIRDHNGAIISALNEPFRGKDSNQSFGATFDLTDDYLDPRKGVRFGLAYQNWPAERAQDPSYYVVDYKLLAYLPMFENDTLVFNYYQSDAHVTKPGTTDPAAIRQELHLNCAAADSACLQSEQHLVDVFTNYRNNGTANPLGGKERLRSFPQGRFRGGHSAFAGAEYRWNFKQGVAPFDYLFWKDVRTGLQLAFFGEVGSVSETAAELWNESRTSYGVGLRLVAASGAVYRADIANGREGAELTLFFYYPWE